MRGRRFILVSIVAGLIVTGQTSASGIHRQQFPVAMSGTVATVPFDLYRGYFTVVHGSVGRLKNLNFFLDTGTRPAVLDSRIAKKLNLHGEEAVRIAIVGGRVEGEMAKLASLRIGPVQRSNLPIVIADLSFFRKVVPVRIDAIVGLDVLGPEPFVIDYSARAIRFGAAPALPDSVPLRLDRGLAVFDAEIGHTPVHLLLDTGASTLILFTRTGSQSQGERNDAVLGAEKIGNFESRPVWLRMFRMGAAEFRKEPALMTLNPKPSQIDFDGLISPVALGLSQIAVNVEGRVLAFSR
jgi:Aspartyl protease